MKKKLIAICLSALMLTSVTSVNCMAKNPYPDEESYSESSFAILQDILRENDCQTGIAFLGYIGYDATTEEILDYTNQEDYVASYPFLKNGTIVDAGGYEVFAIVPASDWSISVYSSEMTEDAVYKDYLDFPLYEGSPDEVIILRCNLSEIYSNTMVTSKEGNMSVSYRPSISLKDGRLQKNSVATIFQSTMISTMDIMVLTTVWKAIFLKIIMRIITVIQYKTLMNFSVQLMRSATIWGWDSLYGIPETKI